MSEVMASGPPVVETHGLLKTFELCTVLVLTGSQPPPDGILPGIRRLHPVLGAREEDEAWEWYTTFQMLTGT